MKLDIVMHLGLEGMTDNCHESDMNHGTAEVNVQAVVMMKTEEVAGG